MGYMTTVTFLNDGWSAIENDPKGFVECISGHDKFHRYNTINNFGLGNFGNMINVARSHHADEDRLYLVGGNMMVSLGYSNDIKNISLRKLLLKTAKMIIKMEEEAIKKLENESIK